MIQSDILLDLVAASITKAERNTDNHDSHVDYHDNRSHDVIGWFRYCARHNI